MFRHVVILLLSMVLGTFAWSKYEFPEDQWLHRLVQKTGPSLWGFENRRPYDRPPKYGYHGSTDPPYDRYSEEDDDDEDSAYVDNCNDVGIRPGFGRPLSSMLRSAKPVVGRSQGGLSRNPRRLPRSVWIPVNMPAPYREGPKHRWNVMNKHFGNNEGFARPARDDFVFSEPIDQGFVRPAELDPNIGTKLRPWTAKTEAEQFLDPLDLKGPGSEKSHNENVNFNSNTNLGRRFDSPRTRRRIMRN